MSARRLTIGGHRYSDPDVISLIETAGGRVDPRLEVIRRARELNQRLKAFAGSPADPRQRIEILASLAGITAAPMTISSSTGGREAPTLPGLSRYSPRRL